MALTEEQVLQLYAFTIKHYVVHYDLQTELVDHLANGIEAQINKNPQLTFKQALLLEFRKFGVHGFEKVISKRKRAMEKRYRKIVFTFFKEYFKLPKVLYYISAIFICFTLISNLNTSWKYDIILGVFYLPIIFVFVRAIRGRKDNELEQVKYGKKWMLKDQIYEYTSVINILNFIPITLNFSFFRDSIPMNSSLVDLCFAMAFVSLVVLCFLITIIIPQKAEELLLETYPEYKFSKNG